MILKQNLNVDYGEENNEEGNLKLTSINPKLNKLFGRKNAIRYDYRIDLTKVPEFNSSL